MFVMAAVNRQLASSVDENLCVIVQLNNGKTQANISNQKQNKITSYMRHTSPANPTATEELNFISAPIALSQVGSAIDYDNLRHPALRTVRLTHSNEGHVKREGRINGSRLF